MEKACEDHEAPPAWPQPNGRGGVCPTRWLSSVLVSAVLYPPCCHIQPLFKQPIYGNPGEVVTIKLSFPS
jgi:hypothetical protein